MTSFYGYNISFSVVALIVMTILLAIISVQYSSTNLVSKRFKFFLISGFMMIALDIFTVFTNGEAKHFPVFISMILNGVVGIFFLYYIVSVAFKNASEKTKKMLYIVNLAVLGVYALSLILNNWFGFYFYFDEALVYSSGPIYILVNLVTIVYVVETLVIMFMKHKEFNTRQMVSTMIFYAFFFMSFIFQLTLFRTTLLSDLGVALGALIVFFSIESPDYIKLMATLNELNELEASLEIQVENRTHELDKEKKSYEELTLETLASLANVIDAKDHYTNGHSFRVAAYSKGISGGAALRARIVHAATVADYKDIFSQFIC